MFSAICYYLINEPKGFGSFFERIGIAMSKSMYSLILIDEVVRAVDKLAHQKGTNRSNLINQILAEHLSLKTPEKRVGEIFVYVENALNDERLQVSQKSGGTLVIKGAVSFKYNPTIRYAIDMQSIQRGYSGSMRVSTRTQSRALLTRLNMFFELWTQIEHTSAKDAKRATPKYEMDDGRFTRKFVAEHRGEGIDHAVLGGELANYVDLFDKAMNIFFETKSGMDIGTYKEMLALYEEFTENCEIMI